MLETQLDDPAFRKLHKMFGREEAQRVWMETLAALGMTAIRTPDDRARLGQALIERGGLLAVIGRSIVTQAVLRGARQILDRIESRRGHE